MIPNPKHFVSSSCDSEICICGNEATHKIGEEIPHDHPWQHRHNLTIYVCCECFMNLFGNGLGCFLAPIQKFNNGRGAILCHNCSVIITEGLRDRDIDIKTGLLFCTDQCQTEFCKDHGIQTDEQRFYRKKH